jgi:Cytochrome P450
VLPTSDGVGIAVPKGTQLSPMVIALHYSRMYNRTVFWSDPNPVTPAKLWDEPSKFKPDRFLREYDQNAFIPFSMGARGCIGRR